ncbi:type VII secretion system-associated protein [Nocardia brasiliensis]|uniref:type VII secretion system-associated protein n=1 Tax=Nocardia brasiliensis TaxID=37326 RepID=UPI002458A5FA|nr:type VII secretion system-associated protein [Nocardia brasiliensis]
MDESIPGVIRQDDWFALMDPAWNPDEQPVPPTELMVGGWPLNRNGQVGPFRPNPGYRPSAATVPTDPIDAVLHRIAAGADHLGDELTATIGDCVVSVACDEQGRPVIGTSPDGIACIIVATAELQKTGTGLPRWRSIHGANLTQVAPPQVDIFLNPAGVVPFRLARTAG